MSKKWFLLGLIVLLAFFLRVYRVDQVPPSLNWDEVSIGYNAYSVLKTGRDEWGIWMPLHFKSYGEYKLPAQVYASIPGIALFGLNTFGVRITPVIYGTLTILVIFFLIRKLYGSEKIALLSALLVAISPWHIQLTRASFEASLALLWVLLGIWLWVKGLGKQPNWLYGSIVFFALAIYTYNSARGFVPLLILALLVIYRQEIWRIKKTCIISIIGLVILMLPLIPFVLSGEGGARYKLVSVADDPGLLPRVNEARGNSHLPPLMARIVHSRYTYIVEKVATNYIAHFDPRFLFISGAPHKQHHPQGIGELYWVEAPFFYLGFWYMLRNIKKNKNNQLVLFWLLLAIVPVALTNDSIPHALRSLNAMPAFNLISVLGFIMVLKYLKSRQVVIGTTIAVSILLIFQFVRYYQYLQTVYPIKYSYDWQFGYQQVVNYVKSHENEYDLVVFSRHYGEPHMFTLFFEQYDPAKYQNDPALDRFETNDWVWVLKFGKYYFPDLGDVGTKFGDIIKMYPDKKILFVGAVNDFPVTQTVLYQVNFLNGDPDFRIVEQK